MSRQPRTEAGQELLSLSEPPTGEELEAWVVRIEDEVAGVIVIPEDGVYLLSTPGFEVPE